MKYPENMPRPEWLMLALLVGYFTTEAIKWMTG